MALTEQRVLKSVEYLVESNSVNILWEDRILRDGQVISTSNHRGAYNLTTFTPSSLPQEDYQELVSILPDLFGN